MYNERDDWEYTPDPSGNNDSIWSCKTCGTWRDRRPSKPCECRAPIIMPTPYDWMKDWNYRPSYPTTAPGHFSCAKCGYLKKEKYFVGDEPTAPHACETAPLTSRSDTLMADLATALRDVVNEVESIMPLFKLDSIEFAKKVLNIKR